jgi:predicted secreted protein
MVSGRVGRVLSAALFLGFIGGFIGAANAQAQTTISVSSTAGANDHNTTLMLNQRVDRRVQRDQVQIDLRIDMLGTDPKQLQTQVKTLLDGAIQKAKAVPQIAIQSGAYTALRQTDPRAPRAVPGAMMMSGNGNAVPMTLSTAGDWHAVQLLSLTATDFAAIAPLVSDLENDGLQLSDMRMSLTPEALRTVQSELAPQAIAALRTQAEKLATAMDMKIERFVNVSVTNSQPENQQLPRPTINFNQQPNQTMIMPSGDFDVWVTVSANVLLAPKAAP